MNGNERAPWARGKVAHGISRRALLRATGGAAIAASRLTAPGVTQAQEAPMATPHPLGSAMPPELTAHAIDWPAPHGNLSAHRAASASPIAAANVDQLAVTWRFPLAAVGGYGR
jgi:hypothetical protein